MDLGERYLEVMLRFGRLAPGLVESSAAPAEMAARVDAEEQISGSALVHQAAELREVVDRVEPDANRAAWLDGQLRGVESACRWLGGERLGYRELVERCHGVQVVDVDEAQFERAHELIARALPGPGTPAERLQAWTAGQLVSGERLVAGLGALADELRARSHEQWNLPDDETVVFEAVSEHPWAAHADYQGSLRTLVRINDDLPITGWRMAQLVAHEAYPGHHTEHVCKDIALMRAHDRIEFSVFVYPTPQALMAEGIAMLAPEVLLGDAIEEVSAQCLRPLGIDYDTDGSAAVRQAHELLLPVVANLALMRDEDRVDRAGMIAYARRWRLDDDAYVERIVDNVCSEQWPPYESCYTEGLRHCRRFVEGDLQRFGRLLREQLTPAALEA